MTTGDDHALARELATAAGEKLLALRQREGFDDPSALRKEGRNATLYTYPGEHHAFGPEWPTSMARTVAFLRRYV